MESKVTDRIAQFDRMKLLLILGVVLIHVNIVSFYSPEDRQMGGWLTVIDSISTVICSVCVPCFFIISGFLFFRNVESFTLAVYKGKLRRRFNTLFIPYMVWCVICFVLMYLRHRYRGFPGLGIFIDDGGVNWLNFVRGFWAIPEYADCPYAYAFWFIRNLMVFSILSPVVYLIARKWWTMALFFVACIVVKHSLGSIWFVIGAYMGLHSVSLTRSKRVYCILGGLYILCMLLMINGVLFEIAKFLFVLSSFFLLYLCSGQFTTKLTGATFMIYATHQCYNLTVVHLYERLLGDNVNVAPIIYLLAFLTLVALGVVINVFVNRYTPFLRPYLTGNR